MTDNPHVPPYDAPPPGQPEQRHEYRRHDDVIVAEKVSLAADFIRIGKLAGAVAAIAVVIGGVVGAGIGGRYSNATELSAAALKPVSDSLGRVSVAVVTMQNTQRANAEKLAQVEQNMQLILYVTCAQLRRTAPAEVPRACP